MGKLTGSDSSMALLHTYTVLYRCLLIALQEYIYVYVYRGKQMRKFCIGFVDACSRRNKMEDYIIKELENKKKKTRRCTYCMHILYIVYRE
jgi:hypothetical protein